MTPAKYQKLYNQEEKDRRAMRRAFRKWEKSADTLKRADKALDKDSQRMHASECHLDDLAASAGIKPKRRR